MRNPRQLAFIALRDVHRHGAFADVALDRILRDSQISDLDRRLVTELVYGSVRRMRSLDRAIDELAKKTASQQPPELRTILHLGFYQLQYLSHIPASAAVNTTVQLAKDNGFSGLSSFVNGLLRQYVRLNSVQQDSLPPYQQEVTENSFPISPPPYQEQERRGNFTPLKLPENPIQRLGILHSFPDWIVELWLKQLGETETEQLCQWFNQSPTIDLRINPLRTTLEEVETAFKSSGIAVNKIPYLPQALRLNGSIGAIQKLPGYHEGWWTIQDSSAQLVTHLLDPQPGETIIDACAAPGGKTTHIAELIQDKGTIFAWDKTESRLKKLRENIQRLQLKSIQVHTGDSRSFGARSAVGDRLLLDAPCSGLGTLHRRADARWRQTPESIQELSTLQSELLANLANFVKPGGILVYATCTIHPLENETVIESFLSKNSNWKIESPNFDFPVPSREGWVKVWPHHYQMDGFFMVKLKRREFDASDRD